MGVYVNRELTFEKHIETVVNQANRMLGLIRRSYTYLDSQSLLKLYTSLVRPTLGVCKCNMDSYPETPPNPTRECSATSNEAETRATRQILRGSATHTETTEPILPKSTWRHNNNNNNILIYKAQLHKSAQSAVLRNAYKTYKT